MNNIFKKWLDKQPPLSVNPLHNGQYYLTDEQALDFAKMYSSEQLRLHSVSQQRELLKKWWKYFDEESVAINCNDEEREEVITNFFNCG